MNRVPAQCYRIVANGYLRRRLCPNPVRWHGLLRPTDERRYRVFSCEDHAETLQDLYPASPKLGDNLHRCPT